jgi:hypothetical protein
MLAVEAFLPCFPPPAPLPFTLFKGPLPPAEERADAEREGEGKCPGEKKPLWMWTLPKGEGKGDEPGEPSEGGESWSEPKQW